MSAWLLLRGWGRETRHWAGFPAQLSAAIPGISPTTLDLPGNGRLRGRTSPLSVEEMVEQCREEVRRLELAAPRYLLGLSLGGMVCLDWAARYPAEVDGVVLINTSFGRICAFHERLRPSAYAALTRLALLRRDASREAAILRLTAASAAAAELLEEWTRYGAELPVSSANLFRQLVAAARYRIPARKPGPPLLLLASAADRLVDCRCSIKLARRWNVPLSLHPDAGHDLTLDDGAWAAAEVAAWLTRT